MITITIPKKQYERLKQHASAYVKIVQEIARAEQVYSYDEKYISTLTQQALRDHKRGKTIAANSVDDAIAKLKRK